MFKKNNESNKPKERPRIKPPEIRPRPAKPFQGGVGPQSNGPSSRKSVPSAAPFFDRRPATAEFFRRSTARRGPAPCATLVRPVPLRETRRGRTPQGRSPRRTGAAKRAGHARAQHVRASRPGHARTRRTTGTKTPSASSRLGGLEEIGRNCSFLEYKNEIVIIDIGLQFPEEETPGIDYIIPNVSYLEKKKENILGDHFDARPLRPHRRPCRTSSRSSAIRRSTRPPSRKRSSKNAQEDFPNAPKMNVITDKERRRDKTLELFQRAFLRRAAHHPGNDRRAS